MGSRYSSVKIFAGAALIILFGTIVLFAYQTGITGQTLKTTSEGCSCHGSFSPSVNVVISGPDSLLPNTTGTYTVTITGGPLVRGGTNIAASSGELTPGVGSGLQKISGELTHINPKPSSDGSVSFQFDYTAPSNLGTQTLFANGNSVNYNQSPDGDQWNWAPNKIVNVVAVIPVELMSFNAQVVANSIILSWSTSTETNNRGFEIQRKLTSEGMDWVNLMFIKGSGTTTELQNYSYQDENLPTGTYSYRLKQIDFDGTSKIYNLSEEIHITAPNDFALNQNFPNPFNPSTVISFSIPKNDKVRLEVFDVVGSRIATLFDEEKSAGYYEINFDALNYTSGVYYYRISTKDFVQTKKMILMR